MLTGNNTLNPTPPSDMDITTVPAPVPPESRILTIDILRGFALLGILLVNMELFNGSFAAVMASLNQPASAAFSKRSRITCRCCARSGCAAWS